MLPTSTTCLEELLATLRHPASPVSSLTKAFSGAALSTSTNGHVPFGEVRARAHACGCTETRHCGEVVLKSTCFNVLIHKKPSKQVQVAPLSCCAFWTLPHGRAPFKVALARQKLHRRSADKQSAH
eukprot:3402462-Amphidinium_carterae.1